MMSFDFSRACAAAPDARTTTDRTAQQKAIRRRTGFLREGWSWSNAPLSRRAGSRVKHRLAQAGRAHRGAAGDAPQLRRDRIADHEAGGAALARRVVQRGINRLGGAERLVGERAAERRRLRTT